MTHNFRFARLRAPVFAALILALAGCGNADAFDPDNGSPTDDESGLPALPVGQPELASASFAGGIPFGNFDQPLTVYGSVFNGGVEVLAPNALLAELAGIRARGGKAVLSFTGNDRHYKTSDGHFSLSKWKARVDRFRGINITSYINDGTVIGHYLIDEPNDPRNWNGKPVPPSVLEEMGRHSKQLWPGMATIVRAEPRYLERNHKYIDAAWAQYLSRKGTAGDYLRRNVAEAQERGLALVVGLNVTHGGIPHGTRMSASEAESWGSTLLSSSYPCAFISWQYDESQMETSSMRSAMSDLRRKAQGRATKSCRG